MPLTFLVERPWITTAAFVACLVVGPVVAYVLIGRARVAWTLLVLSLFPVAALTLSPGGREMTVSCARSTAFPDFGAVELMANVVLFVPPALLLAVALGRPVAAFLAASGVSALIEAVQAFVTALGRSCSTDDWLSNTLGAMVGALLAAAALGVHRRAGRP